MPLFIKTEFFTELTYSLSSLERKIYIDAHKEWINDLVNSGIKVASGYLVDELQNPGGGGLLILEANNLNDAKEIINKDPIILAGLVDWKLQEWKQVSKNSLLDSD